MSRLEVGTWDLQSLKVEIAASAAGGVRRLTIFAPDSLCTGVTSTALRALPLAAMERSLFQGRTPHVEPDRRAWDVARPGRPGRPDRDYALVAARYVNLLHVMHPTKTLASELEITPTQLRNVLTEARRRDLLTPARVGRAGGQLTAKAARLLDRPFSSSDFGGEHQMRCLTPADLDVFVAAL